MTGKEKKLAEVFKNYWETYFSRGKGVRDKIFSMWHPNITAIGTGKDEIVDRIDSLKKFVNREFREMKHTLPVKILWTNVKIYEQIALVSGELEVLLSQKEELKMTARNTLMFKKYYGKWLIVHLHASFPSSDQRQNQSFPIDGLIAKKEELEKQVEEKTADLLLKNRELEIETALEKVRTIAMGMRDPTDMLDVCKTISLQLQSLGVKEIRNVQTAIFYEQRGTYMNYEYYAKHNKTFITETSYTNHKIHNEFATKMLKGKGESFITHIKGKEVKEWIAYQKKTNVFIDKYLETASSLNYYWFSLGPVAVGISTYHPLTEEETNLFKRFLKVFELAYRRYLDIEKAEAQAREAQIETALERVRARTMAMHKSEELSETAEVLFEQFNLLGKIPDRMGIGIINEKTKKVDFWVTDQGGNQLSHEFFYSLDEPTCIAKIYNAWKQDSDSIIVDLTGQNLQDWLQFVKENVKLPIDETKIKGRRIQHAAFFSQGFLLLTTHEPVTSEIMHLLVRIAKVFDQTYTRFLDLQKAEAQAREAKIEAALQRVRARTMAMHNSDELAETAAVVFNQLIGLGIAPNRLYICIIKDETGIGEFWITDEDGSKVSTGFKANLNENRSFQKMYEGWKEQIKSTTIDIQGKELEEYFLHLSKLQVPFKGGLSQKRRIQSIAYFSKGFIGIASPDSQPEETTDLLERFAAVFNLTYTRFNDLQQAEAQNIIIQAENDRKTSELEEARELQLSMLPKELPNLPNLDIAVYMKTATEVGGDYYDFHLGEDGTLTAVIGDATGHGMKAGTMVTITKSLFDGLASSDNILETFDKISKVIKGMKIRQLSMCLMMLKIKEDKLILSSAAMPPVLIYQKKKQAVEELFLKGMPLGAMNNFPYAVRENHLVKGDTILLMSDGLPELMNDNNEMYGYDRIKTKYHLVGEKEPEEIVNHLKNSASQWSNGKDADDDVTFVVIKVK